MGENIKKITSFFETLEGEYKFGVGNVLRGIERGRLTTRPKSTASGGGGEGKTVLDKRGGGTSGLS